LARNNLDFTLPLIPREERQQTLKLIVVDAATGKAPAFSSLHSLSLQRPVWSHPDRQPNPGRQQPLQFGLAEQRDLIFMGRGPLWR